MSDSLQKQYKRITVPDIILRKGAPEKIVCVTAYDYISAAIVDSLNKESNTQERGEIRTEKNINRTVIDLILVGDSLSSIVQGRTTTLSVELDEMVYHSRCVTRAVERALVVGDMPFLSYTISKKEALRAAGRFVKEAQVSAVKVEGGKNICKTIQYIVDADIPVLGHIGLTPQSVNKFGEYTVQGRKSSVDAPFAYKRSKKTREEIIDDAVRVEAAGAFAVVLECIPDDLAKEITEKLQIPTIGIGAGKSCDGQILVLHDLLGITTNGPKFVKQFGKLREAMESALQLYSTEVKNGLFPGKENIYT
jgi:3-methyl-2-oxobutanoate hydroxymethyltransferase